MPETKNKKLTALGRVDATLAVANMAIDLQHVEGGRWVVVREVTGQETERSDPEGFGPAVELYTRRLTEEALRALGEHPLAVDFKKWCTGSARTRVESFVRAKGEG